jgi:hypothetical protein
MTYAELVQKLQKMIADNPEVGYQDVTIRVDEYYPARLAISPEDDVLDKGHPFIEIRR